MSADGRWTSSCLSKQKLLQKTEVLCKFASKQEVLTNCCKIETLQIAEKTRGFAQIATKKDRDFATQKRLQQKRGTRNLLQICHTPTSV
jgi:hypothetical protein